MIDTPETDENGRPLRRPLPPTLRPPEVAPPMMPGATALPPLPMPHPAVTNPAAQKLEGDQAELSRIQTSGSGVDQLRARHPVLGTLAKVADIAGGAMFPGVSVLTPGTALHHQAVENRQEGRVAEDLGEQQRQATIADTESQQREREASADARLHPPAKPANPAQLAKLAQLGYKMGDDGELTPMGDEELSPELKAQRELQDATREYRQAQAGLAKSKNDPNSAAYKLEQAKVAAAQERTHQAMAAMGLHQQEFENKISEQGLVKPSGQTESRGSAAQSALDMLPNLNADIDRLKDKLGPGIGRLMKWEGVIGNVDPDVSALYSKMKQFYSILGAAHGWRAIQTPAEFEKAMGGLERNPEALKAAMQGAAAGLTNIAQEGKTFHRRIVEPPPTGGPATGGAPAAGTVEGGFRFKGGDPKDQHNWEKVQP